MLVWKLSKLDPYHLSLTLLGGRPSANHLHKYYNLTELYWLLICLGSLASGAIQTAVGLG